MEAVGQVAANTQSTSARPGRPGHSLYVVHLSPCSPGSLFLFRCSGDPGWSLCPECPPSMALVQSVAPFLRIEPCSQLNSCSQLDS